MFSLKSVSAKLDTDIGVPVVPIITDNDGEKQDDVRALR